MPKLTPHCPLMFFCRIIDTEIDFLFELIVCGLKIRRQRYAHLSCFHQSAQLFSTGSSALPCIPNGPVTSTAVVGVSGFLLRAFDLGRS